MTTADRLFDRYGPALSGEQLAEALHMTLKTLDAQRQRGDFPIQPFRWTGRRTPLWHYQDVADWLDSMRAGIPAGAGYTAEAGSMSGAQ